jgi:hypothetical protein
MKHQKYYTFLQKQILLMVGLSLIPGLVYVIVGWIFHIVTPALVWYGILLCISLYGWTLYHEFSSHKMDEEHLRKWYSKLTWFMYVIFSFWSLIFVMYVRYDEYHIHYIAIFTQLGAAVVASTLLISDKKLFVPILVTLMLPLIVYFAFICGYMVWICTVYFFSYISLCTIVCFL